VEQVFGLGLALNFVDNATAGMNQAVRSFQAMSGACSSLTGSFSDVATQSMALSVVGSTMAQLGNEMYDTGRGTSRPAECAISVNDL
jgi:hypothetical protein